MWYKLTKAFVHIHVHYIFFFTILRLYTYYLLIKIHCTCLLFFLCGLFLIPLFLPASLHPSRLQLFSCQYHVWKVSPRVSLGLVNLSAAARLKGRLLAQEGQEHLRSHGAFFSLWTHSCCFRHVLFRATTSLGTCKGPRGCSFLCDTSIWWRLLV